MDQDTITKIIDSAPPVAEFLANTIVIIGAIPVFIWLKNRSFDKRKQEIKDNLSIRKNIQDKLREHADGYDRTVAQSIGIRLVYWKNYPWKLDDDGYKQGLYYDTNLDKRVSHGTEFLTNTGILVEDHIWFLSRSLYLGKYGIYTIAKPGLNLKGFSEVNQKIKIISTLKYKYVINWDFEEKIEYEPVFYTKYKYTNVKLFENQIFAQNYDDDGINNDLYFHEVLDRRNRVKRSKSTKYLLLMLKGWLIERREINKMKHLYEKSQTPKKKRSKD
jgi:hypothetical protein